MEFFFSDHNEVDNLDKVPKDYQGLYEEKDGKFALRSDDHSKSAVAAITSLSRSLKASRGEVKAAKDGQIDISSLSEFGTTVEEVLTGFNTRLEEVRKTKPGDKEAQKQALASQATELTRAHDAKTTALGDENKALTGQLHGLLVTNTLTQALIDAGSPNPDLVLPHLANSIRVDKAENGQLSVGVVDAQGLERFGGTGNRMTLAELVTEFKSDERHGAFFNSEQKSGGGSETTRRAISKDQSTKREDMTAQEKIQSGLRARAGKS